MSVNDDACCSICQETLVSCEPTCTTKCGHTFHSKCFMEAIAKSPSCPICRTKLYTPEADTNTEDDEIGSDIEEISFVIRDFYRPTDDNDDAFRKCEEGNTREITEMLRNGDLRPDTRHAITSGNLLHTGILSGSDQMCRLLVQEGVNVNEKDLFQISPLHLAVKSSSVLLVDFLLNSGAFIDCRDAEGKTPLAHACLDQCTTIVRHLIDKGASTRDQDLGGNTVLHHAVNHGESSFEILKMILKCRNIDINAQNHLGDTALHRAVVLGCKNSVRKLLRYGAHPFFKNRAGKTPEHCVRTNDRRTREILTNTVARSRSRLF